MVARRRYDPAEPLVSVHVPKCAGTSFAQVLRGWFGPEGFYTHYYNETENRPPPIHPLWNADGSANLPFPVCVHGHFNAQRGMGVEDCYPHATQLITIIRDPFEMQISNYFYVREAHLQKTDGAKRSGEDHPIIAGEWSLEEFLRHNPKSHLLHFLPAGIDASNFQAVIESRFLYVGISECLDKCANELASRLGLPEPDVPLENASVRRSSVDPALRAWFVEQNPLEYAIYEHAAEKVAAR